jgi:lipopolysaccharide transport system ATP-binding protein
MPSDLAIRLRNVCKTYHLHGSRRDQFIHVMELHRFGFKPRSPAVEFKALDSVSLDVPRGQRIGIIGRNGAGKTTLLKLICGTFSPTSGSITVNGFVQALMSVGLGFHPEYTGRENIEASLHYNNLSTADYKAAIADIIEFAELGEFMDQPFKTYSLGMQARLMFATSTAIKPDILIVDEALGAGDAYFVAKSKQRVEKLVKSGCTLLLVSHSTGHILELCSEAIWLEKGAVKMQADALSVIKAYEKHISAGAAEQTDKPISVARVDDTPTTKAIHQSTSLNPDGPGGTQTEMGALLLQEPKFRPNTEAVTLPPWRGHPRFEFVARDGVSRWGDEEPKELEITGFSIIAQTAVDKPLIPLRSAKFLVVLSVRQTGSYSCRYAITITNYYGHIISRFRSPCDSFSAEIGDLRTVELVLNPLQYGSGSYIVSVGVFEYQPLETINTTKRYDLLSRSFCFEVQVPESEAVNDCSFFHTGEWLFGSERKDEPVITSPC